MEHVERRTHTRGWTFETLTDEELKAVSYGRRLDGRWLFLDADAADPESLDDGPRPSDRLDPGAQR